MTVRLLSLPTRRKLQVGGMVARKGEGCPCFTRRGILKTALGMAWGFHFVDGAPAQQTDPRQMRPQKNDRFVFAFGEKAGSMIMPEDLRLGEPPVFGYPMDPETHVVRNGSRLNQVLLVSLNPEELSEKTREYSAQGILAYSAVCPHTGCDVSEWNPEKRNLVCPCHSSEFDPRDKARVLNGPAEKRLAILPLALSGGTLVVAGSFSGRVGFKKK